MGPTSIILTLVSLFLFKRLKIYPRAMALRGGGGD
jgi:hypothetical protein